MKLPPDPPGDPDTSSALTRRVRDLEETVARQAAALREAEAETKRLGARLEGENAYLRDEALSGSGLSLLLGHGPAMQAVRRAIAQVAQTDSTVLIHGETGTGKELVARAVHVLSPRRENLLVKVNCAALAPGVLTSELFGHEAGAFTGATRRRIGRFEIAHHGSIFLDEIGEVPPEVQVHLLRVLQERVIERVGGNEPIAVDVRVITATNRDLGAAMAEGSFRPDLFYRLNVFPIRLPPLRERPEDVSLLIGQFVARFSRRMNKPVRRASERTLELAREYPWPGNVRELENLVERGMIVCEGDTLEIDPGWLAPPADSAEVPADNQPLAERERRAILQALTRCDGKIYGPGGAAEALGLRPTTLYGKLRKHGIRRQPGSNRFV
jgi:formate hydrogenlyase transcriptional activator